MDHNNRPLSRKHTLWLHAAAFLLPFCVCIAALFFLDLYPFGAKSLIISDANGQYLDFAAWWQRVLTGENSLFYTFGKNMGGDGLNLAAYYLLSPVNLLFLLSGPENLPLLFTLVIVTKLSLCGLAFFFAASRLYGTDRHQLLFSTAYALMAYNVAFGWNIMWLDGVIILPLLTLGLYRLLQDRNPLLYVFSLMYALATNFYIGYMLCIAATLFCFAILILQQNGWKVSFRRFFRFALFSLTGGFLAAPVWLPAFLSISGERGQTNPFRVSLDRSFGILSFPAKLFCGAVNPQDIMGGLPNIFCGTLILLLAAAFFLNRKITLRKKLIGLTVLGILFLSFFFQTPNMVWHGFSPTNAFNFRYSFLFSFVLILIALDQFHHRDTLTIPGVLASGGLAAALLMAALLRAPKFLTLAGIAVTFLVLACGTVCLLPMHKHAKLRTIRMPLFCAVLIVELFANCLCSWGSMTDDEWTLHIQDYRDFLRTTAPAVDYVKQTDPGFYRMEKNFHRSENDPSLFAYNGLSHFSSTEPVFTKQFLRKMGYTTEYDFLALYGEGSTAEADTLLGVKYLLSKKDLSDQKNYTQVSKVNDVFVYRNENALPVAMLCSDAILQTDMAETDPVRLHNRIWQTLSDQTGDILIPEAHTVITENLEMTATEEGHLLFSKIDREAPAFIHYQIPITRELPLYAYFTAPDYQGAELIINGESDGSYFDNRRWNMVNTGTWTSGDTLSVSLAVTEESLCLTQAYFFYEDPYPLSAMTIPILSSAPSFRQDSGTCFTGTFRADADQLLLFTFPQSKGWTLTLDGEPVPLITALNTFPAAQISAGEHEFRLTYQTPGLLPGCMLGATALLCLIVWYLYSKKRPKV